MAQIHVIGRVTEDLEVKTGTSGNPYVCFALAESVGREHKMQYFRVWAWRNAVNQLVNAHVGKGSLIWVSGSLELETFTRRDGVTVDKAMKIRLDNWGFMRFIRFTSTEWKDIYFITYASSIESNLMQMVLAKEKTNLFMKGKDTDLDEIYDRFGVDYDLLSLLMYREADENGHFHIRWGEQKIA